MVSNRTAKLVRFIIPQCGIPGSNPGPATNSNTPPQAGVFMSETSCYQVYVIRNTAGKLYIGLSENVSKRLEQHIQGAWPG